MSSSQQPDTRFRLSREQAEALAAEFGTPLYVLDEATLRGCIREYRDAFTAVYPNSELSYASKANSILAVLQIAHQEGCSIDVASEGELRAALAAGVPAERCYFHGNNKSEAELRFAFDKGIGFVVADNFGELELLASLRRGALAKLILRLAPGVDPVTHHLISTGQADTKFGFNIADGSAEKAVLRCLDLGLPLIGFHCHVGSQLLDPEAQRAGGEALARLAVHLRREHGYQTEYLNVGGGLGVRYTDEDRPTSVDDYCRLIVQAVDEALDGSGLQPKLGQEPGRALVAESGVTLYTVGAIKTVPSGKSETRTYVSVDGGLSDNPRPHLYESRYQVECLTRDGAMQTVTVSGKHCETDTLFTDVQLPQELKAGDLLQVLCTGAYNASMASNYNRFRRPACVLIRADSSTAVVQRRETWEELLSRETLLEGGLGF